MLRARTLIIVSIALASIATSGYMASAQPPAARTSIGASRVLAENVRADDLTIACPDGNTVSGERIAGLKGKRHPGVLFVHWLGSPKTTNRTEFEPDAVALARSGATSILVDAMWSKPNWFDGVGLSEDKDSAATEQQIGELRCALDELTAEPGVDPSRLAYVGHDFGAMFGALLAGRDARPRVFVLMAGTPQLADWYRFEKKLPNDQAYRAVIDKFDTLAALRASKAKAFLLQFSDKDFYIPRDRALVFAAAAPEPKTLIFYGTDHSLEIPQVHRDRLNWLDKQLF